MQAFDVGDRVMTRYGYGTVTEVDIPSVHVRLDWSFHGQTVMQFTYHDLAIPSAYCVVRYSGEQLADHRGRVLLAGQAIFGSEEYCLEQYFLPTPNRRFALLIDTTTRVVRVDGWPLDWVEDYVLFRAGVGMAIPWLPIGVASADRVGPLADWVDLHKEGNASTIEGIVLSCILDQRTKTIPWLEFHTEAGWIRYLVHNPSPRRQ